MRSTTASLLAFASILFGHFSVHAQTYSSSPAVEIFAADSSRLLAELSDRDTCGAYPWLSPDGLRLYYTACGSGIGFKMGVRETTSQPFAEVQALNVMSDDNYHLSCWLTHDELSMYFVMHRGKGVISTTLYRVDRTGSEGPFSEPVEIELLGEVRGFLSGPSLTKDRKFLYLYNDLEINRKRILEFKQVDENTYRLFDTLPIPDGIGIGPGQLSKNDLRYYVGVKEGGKSKTLGCYYRESTSVPFRDFVRLEGYLSDTNNAAHLPTISADESTIVFSASNDHLWGGNRLYIAQRRAPEVVAEFPDSRIRINQYLALYPNPAQHTLHIEYRSASDDESVVLLFDGNGNEVHRLSVPGHETHVAVDISNLPSGSYSCQSRTGEGSSELYGFVVLR